MLSKSHQTPINWKLRGHVPLEEAGQVARLLGEESVWGFNYEGLAQLTGKAPKWREVVNSYGLPRSMVAWVLEVPGPKLPAFVEIVSHDVLEALVAKTIFQRQS
jgi:hypothetical protein